jgi:protein-S-isoprenylcysteine O-methyltransferase Ste14
LVAISVVFFFAILYRSEFVLPSDSSLTDAWKQMVGVLVALVIGVVGLVYPVTLKAVSTALLQSRTVNGQSVEHRSGTREGGISASANA